MDGDGTTQAVLLDASVGRSDECTAIGSRCISAARRAIIARMTTPRIRVEILTFENCPNADTAREHVLQALEAEALDAAIVEVAVETPALAHELQFLGSPSVRVNGRDVESGAERRDAYGLMCRTYREGSRMVGSPPLTVIRDALRAADARARDE